MFPLRDENPTSRTPWVTWALVALNFAVFAYEFVLSVSRPGDFDALLQAFAFVPDRFFAAPLSAASWLTVFTAMFMHAGWLHVGGNMLYLWIFGNNVEDRLGPVRFLGFYLLCGIAATFAQAIIAPGSDLPSRGASGAVAGVLGAYLLLYPRARVVTIIFLLLFIETVALPAWGLILGWFLLQLAQGIGGLTQAAQGGVAYFAHVGGFVMGMLLAVPLMVKDRQAQVRYAGWR